MRKQRRRKYKYAFNEHEMEFDVTMKWNVGALARFAGNDDRDESRIRGPARHRVFIEILTEPVRTLKIITIFVNRCNRNSR